MKAPFRRRLLALLAATGAVVGSPSPANADNPVLRHQEDLHGNVAVFGQHPRRSTAARASRPPAGATPSCAGQVNVADTAPDLYWRDNTANATITPTQARTSATLILPAGATVTYARLYWARSRTAPPPTRGAVLDWLGGPQQTITADKTWVVPYGSRPTRPGTITSPPATRPSFVSTWGAGDFRVSDVEALPALRCASTSIAPSRPGRWWSSTRTPATSSATSRSSTASRPSIRGPGRRRAPRSPSRASSSRQGFSAQMTAFTYEGDSHLHRRSLHPQRRSAHRRAEPGRQLLQLLAQQPRGRRSPARSTCPSSAARPGSMAGYDLDTVDVTSHLTPGDTSCEVGADSAKDIFFLGGFVTSVANRSPPTSRASAKDVVDLNGGAVVPGDVLRIHHHRDQQRQRRREEHGAHRRDRGGLKFVPGSIEIVAGRRRRQQDRRRRRRSGRLRRRHADGDRARRRRRQRAPPAARWMSARRSRSASRSRSRR